MAYSEQEWKDNDPTKPVSAARLNHMEKGIGSSVQTVGGRAEASQLPADIVYNGHGAMEILGTPAPGQAPVAINTTQAEWQEVVAGGGEGGGGSGSGELVFQTTPENFGAKRDGKLLRDCKIAEGSKILESATHTFTAEDIGKIFLIQYAGKPFSGEQTVNGPLSAKIVAVAAGKAELNVNAGSTVTGTGVSGWGVFGTDDTAAILEAVEHALGEAKAATRFAVVRFSAQEGRNVYMMGGACKTGASKTNAQVPIPINTPPDEWLTLVLQGCSASTSPNEAGPILLSTLQGQKKNEKEVPPSMIGSPAPEEGFTGDGLLNDTDIRVDGLSMIVPEYPTISCLDLRGSTAASIGTLTCKAFGNFEEFPGKPGFADSEEFATGLMMPQNANANNCDIWSYNADGLFCALDVGEHTTAHRVRIIFCRVGVNFSAQYTHTSRIDYLSTEACLFHIYTGNTVLSEGLFCGFNVGTWDIENTTAGGFGTHYNLYDENEILVGSIDGVWPISAAGGEEPPLVVAGGKKISLKNLKSIPGHVESPPSVPATKVALLNPFWRDADVIIHGGTVTAIKVDGATMGITSGMVPWPSGKSIELEYSSAPAWTIIIKS